MTIKTLAFAAIVGAVSLIGVQAARADSFTPVSSTRQFQGNVLLGSGGIVLNCVLTITVSTNAAGSDAAITAATLTGGICTALAPGSLPWNVDVQAPLPPPINQPASQLKATGVAIGSCVGDLIGNWNPSGPSLTFPAGSLLGTCPVQGILNQTSGTPLVITN